ncbi:hypothetical protein A1O3_05100 [Capronia epimyces CBS 606.96]|uniref:Uncharacterized protein n=1 Tax=Capronia epimyces CBS 606.96 TaxID=1182542 RepID=W9XV58_9EURO|nr:uncharacterized protein A1O3_05100 [Capronia epimyces CBS 606.96]EXJ84432.1 hypothetical protein A1O3_05100 [Capronia epimyces CBS 606.96]
MASGHRYELVKEGDDIADVPQHKRTPIISSWWKFLLCNLIAASVGAGAMFLIVRGSFAPQPSSSTAASVPISTTSSTGLALPTPTTEQTPSVEHVEAETGSVNPLAGKILDCGHNPEEARAKGCVYDVMMQDWVPEPCYDSVLTEKYLAEGNWTWYADGEGKTTLSDEEMRKGEHGGAWMSTSYHKAHCIFSWLKIIRALRNNRGISQELLSYDHVLHCSHGALKERSDDEGLGVRAPTNYAKCALYDTWIQDLIPDKHDSTLR